MRLAECDGKALLRRHGVAVPRGVLVHAGESPPDDIAGWPGFVLKAQLLEGGVLEKNIFVTELCTSCDVDRLFSYRKEGPMSGRLLGVVGIRA